MIWRSLRSAAPFPPVCRDTRSIAPPSIRTRPRSSLWPAMAMAAMRSTASPSRPASISSVTAGTSRRPMKPPPSLVQRRPSFISPILIPPMPTAIRIPRRAALTATLRSAMTSSPPSPRAIPAAQHFSSMTSMAMVSWSPMKSPSLASPPSSLTPALAHGPAMARASGDRFSRHTRTSSMALWACPNRLR